MTESNTEGHMIAKTVTSWGFCMAKLQHQGYNLNAVIIYIYINICFLAGLVTVSFVYSSWYTIGKILMFLN